MRVLIAVVALVVLGLAAVYALNTNRTNVTSAFTCGRWRTRTSDRSLVRRVLYL